MIDLKVLIVEDESFIVDTYHTIINELRVTCPKVNITTEVTGTSDLSIEPNSIDVVILDLRLADGLSLELIKGIESKNPEVKTILITGEASELSNNLNYINSDLNIYKIWIKPLEYSKLKAAISDVISTAVKDKRQGKYYSMLQKAYHSMKNSAAGIIITDINGIIEYVNNAFLYMSGYSSSEVIGAPLSILKSGEHEDSFYKTFWDNISAGIVTNLVFTNKKKDGSLYYQESTIIPYTGPSGKIENYIAHIFDITETRSRDLEFEALIDTLPETLILFDKSMKCIRLYPESNSKIAVADILGLHISEMPNIPTDTKDELLNIFNTINTGVSQSFYLEFKTEIDNKIIFYEVLAKRFNSEKFMVILRNITEHKILSQFEKVNNQLAELANKNAELVSKFLTKN